MIKRWFNRRFPYYRLCGRSWCLWPMTYDHRCARHQDDNRSTAILAHPLAGFCDHGIGMLDQCDACCPPAHRSAS